MDSNITNKVQDLEKDIITTDNFIEYMLTTYGLTTDNDFVTLLSELNAIKNKDKTRVVVEAIIANYPNSHVRIFGYYTNILVELGRKDLLFKEFVNYKNQFAEDKQLMLLELYLLLNDGFDENADRIITLTENIK